MQLVNKSVFIDDVDESSNSSEVGVSTDIVKKEFEEEISTNVSAVSGKHLKIELKDGKVLLFDDVIEFVFGRSYFYFIRMKEGTTSIQSDTIKNVFLFSHISSKWRKVLVPKFNKGV